jgi:signal transduction histidine kinase
MTIRSKLSLSTAALILAVLSLLGALQFYIEGKGLRQQERASFSVETSRFDRLVRESFIEGDEKALINSAQNMPPGGLYVLAVGKDGRVFFDSRQPGKKDNFLKDFFTDAAAKAQLPAQIAGPTVLEFISQLKSGPDGVKPPLLRIGYDLAAENVLVASWRGKFLKRFAMVACASLIVGLLGAWFLANSFTRTINKLMVGAHRIGEGELEAKVLTQRQDELGALSDEFNTMGQKLAELEAMKQRFLETVTHDLRSPLVSIKGYVEIIQQGLSGPVNEKQGEQLGIVLKSSLRLSHLINDILDLSKLEAGKMEFDLTETDIGQVAREVHELLIVLADQYKVKLELNVADDLPKVQADGDQINRVITNFVSNALKFTPEGGTVTISAMRDGSGVKMSVSDTGCGIPKEKLPEMFTKFFQVKESQGKARNRGTGLGLTICKYIVESHGGEVTVQSEWGKGSTFTLTLPQTQPAAQVA